MPLDDGGEPCTSTSSPADPTEPLSHDMSDEEISALLLDDPADIVVCGGSHVPFDRTVSGARVINVGSVGEAPRGHAPFLHADATLLEVGRRGEEWSVDQVAVERLIVPLGKAA
jgi:predicted phosphodiesterase